MDEIERSGGLEIGQYVRVSMDTSADDPLPHGTLARIKDMGERGIEVVYAHANQRVARWLRGCVLLPVELYVVS